MAVAPMALGAREEDRGTAARSAAPRPPAPAHSPASLQHEGGGAKDAHADGRSMSFELLFSAMTPASVHRRWSGRSCAARRSSGRGQRRWCGTTLLLEVKQAGGGVADQIHMRRSQQAVKPVGASCTRVIWLFKARNAKTTREKDSMYLIYLRRFWGPAGSRPCLVRIF